MRLCTLPCLALMAVAAASAMPPEKVQAWQEDLALMTTEYLDQEKTLIGDKRADFVDAIESLRNDLPTITEEATLVRLCQALTIAENAHTRAYGLIDSGLCRRVPVDAWWFEDGLYVVRTRPAHGDMLGGRITQIAGHPVDEAFDAASTILYGNDSRHRAMALPYLFSPEILAGLGLMEAPGPVSIEYEKDGARASRTVEPDPGSQETDYNAWLPLSPRTEAGAGEWVHVLDDHKGDLPHYLRNPDRVFWYEALTNPGLLYMQYNRSRGPEEGMGRLRWDLPDIVEKDSTRAVVLDMRFNPGGDYTILRPVLDKLLAMDKLHEPNRCFVITGAPTFSAGISNTVYMKQEAGAVIVGEPLGDHLDAWAEGGTLILPNSNIRVGTNDGFHHYSTDPMTEHEREHLHTDMNVETIQPDIPAAPTFEAYRTGRDLALEAIIQALK